MMGDGHGMGHNTVSTGQHNLFMFSITNEHDAIMDALARQARARGLHGLPRRLEGTERRGSAPRAVGYPTRTMSARPSAMRYQPNGVKLWVCRYRSSHFTATKATTTDTAKPTASSVQFSSTM